MTAKIQKGKRITQSTKKNIKKLEIFFKKNESKN